MAVMALLMLPLFTAALVQTQEEVVRLRVDIRVFGTQEVSAFLHFLFFLTPMQVKILL